MGKAQASLKSCEKNRHRSTKVKEGATEGEAVRRLRKCRNRWRGRGKDAADGDMGNLGGEVTGS